jgi:hypothetical protein
MRLGPLGRGLRPTVTCRVPVDRLKFSRWQLRCDLPATSRVTTSRSMDLCRGSSALFLFLVCPTVSF